MLAMVAMNQRQYILLQIALDLIGQAQDSGPLIQAESAAQMGGAGTQQLGIIEQIMTAAFLQDLFAMEIHRLLAITHLAAMLQLKALGIQANLFCGAMLLRRLDHVQHLTRQTSLALQVMWVNGILQEG
jgi:hypothetical protein